LYFDILKFASLIQHLRPTASDSKFFCRDYSTDTTVGIRDPKMGARQARKAFRPSVGTDFLFTEAQ
jgi:hypothetical protein